MRGYRGRCVQSLESGSMPMMSMMLMGTWWSPPALVGTGILARPGRTSTVSTLAPDWLPYHVTSRTVPILTTVWW